MLCLQKLHNSTVDSCEEFKHSNLTSWDKTEMALEQSYRPYTCIPQVMHKEHILWQTGMGVQSTVTRHAWLLTDLRSWAPNRAAFSWNGTPDNAGSWQNTKHSDLQRLNFHSTMTWFIISPNTYVTFKTPLIEFSSNQNTVTTLTSIVTVT